MPGGKIEHSFGPEILQRTLKDEIKEEVGLEITDTINLIYNDSFKRIDRAPVVNLTFLCKWQAGEAQALEDTAAVKWFTLEELKNFDEAEDFLKKEIEHLENYLKVSNNRE